MIGFSCASAPICHTKQFNVLISFCSYFSKLNFFQFPFLFLLNSLQRFYHFLPIKMLKIFTDWCNFKGSLYKAFFKYNKEPLKRYRISSVKLLTLTATRMKMKIRFKKVSSYIIGFLNQELCKQLYLMVSSSDLINLYRF